MDYLDSIYESLSESDIRNLNRTVDAMNESLGYAPGMSIIKQEIGEGVGAHVHDVLTLYALRLEAYGLLEDLGRLAAGLAASMNSDSRVRAGRARLKSLRRCLDVTFVQNEVTVGALFR